jgi:hypothetical protein
MSGGVRTFKLANGGYADVPEDKMDEWMRRMDKRGIKFTTDDAPAGDPDEPGFNPWKGPDQIPISDADREDVNGSFRRDLTDAGRGFTQGALAGGADELVGALRGSDQRDIARAQDAVSQERSPWLYRGAQAIGGLPAALAAGARGAVPYGMLNGMLGGNARNSDELVDSAAAGGATAAALHGLGEGVGAAGRLAQGASGMLGNVANEARNAAFGGTQGDFQKAARLKGLDYVENDLPQAAERLGLTNRLIPQSPSQYARRADAMKTTEGAAEGAALTEAGENVATYTPVDELAAGLRRRGAGARDSTLEGVAEESRMRDMADLLLSERGMPGLKRAPELDPMDMLYGGGPEVTDPGPAFLPTGRTAPGSAGMMSPAELNAQKSAYYDRGYKQQGQSDATSQLGASTNRMAGAEAREQLLAALSHAPEGVKSRYEQAAQNYGELATIGDMARNRAAANQASSQGQGFFGTLTQPATRALKNYGPDMAANMAALGRDATGGMGNAMQGAAPYARGMAAGAMPGATQGMGAMGAQAAGADDNPPGDPLASGRGYLLPQVVADLARTNPQALGPYYQQIAQAMQGQNNSGQLNALLERLERDQQWSQNYLPQLRARTAQGAGY